LILLTNDSNPSTSNPPLVDPETSLSSIALNSLSELLLLLLNRISITTACNFLVVYSKAAPDEI
jgi:hypothetical protein